LGIESNRWPDSSGRSRIGGVSSFWILSAGKTACPTIHPLLRALRRFCTTAKAVEVMWGRLLTCGRLGVPPGPGQLPVTSDTVCGLPLCGAGLQTCGRLANRPAGSGCNASTNAIAVCGLPLCGAVWRGYLLGPADW
jgi:hypothetical protein